VPPTLPFSCCEFLFCLGSSSTSPRTGGARSNHQIAYVDDVQGHEEPPSMQDRAPSDEYDTENAHRQGCRGVVNTFLLKARAP
jgi:hypothetical protein